MKRIHLNILAILVIIPILMSFMSSWRNTYVQAQTSVECGAIIEGEFTKSNEVHTYFLTMEPRESFSLSVEPVGDFLNTQITIYEPAGSRIGDTGYWAQKTPRIESGTLGARGEYKIEVRNHGGTGGGTAGIYTLSIGCITNEGPVNPDDTYTSQQTTPSSPPTQPTTEFSGVGFPGVPPVDFSNMFKLEFQDGFPIPGKMPPGFNNVVGFTFNAAAGDVLDLSYTRQSGNLNLGLVVLFPQSQVYFQSSLVTSDRLNTRLTLPEAGEYTIGVFQINLVAPATPEETSFELIGKLNPE